jgi:hypothetical protein
LLENGINTILADKELIYWIQYGAQMEDDPNCRAANHFHNPYLDWWTASGLDDPFPLSNWICWAFSPYPPEAIKSNVSWATGFDDRGYINPSSNVAEINEWDWDSARAYYQAYLTGRDPEIDADAIVAVEQGRNQYLSQTFQALGHVIFIQDTDGLWKIRFF